MWLSQRRQTELEETAAELGQVTVPGAPAGVALAGERDLRVLGAVWEEETQTLTVSVAWEDERLDVTLDASDLVVGT